MTNRTTFQPIDLVARRKAIIATAEELMAAYPQYRGHWDGPEWTLWVATRDVKTKLGLAFRAGEIFLGKPSEQIEGLPHRDSITGWSIRNRCDTSVPQCWCTTAEIDPID